MDREDKTLGTGHGARAAEGEAPRALTGGIALPPFYRHVPGAELPMVVWLRGDEDLMDEFTVDADGAMAYLGIKRTRLTQISGRELRVARVRIDRYVRPMYRPADLEAYRAWTRAPVTHQSAAGTIRDAAKELEDVAASLLARWRTQDPPVAAPSAAASVTVAWDRADAEALRAALAGFESRWRHAAHGQAQWWEDAVARLRATVAAQGEAVAGLAQSHKEGAVVQEALFADLQRVLEKVTSLEWRAERAGEDARTLGQRQDQLAQLVMHTWQKWQDGLDEARGAWDAATAQCEAAVAACLAVREDACAARADALAAREEALRAQEAALTAREARMAEREQAWTARGEGARAGDLAGKPWPRPARKPSRAWSRTAAQRG